MGKNKKGNNVQGTEVANEQNNNVANVENNNINENYSNETVQTEDEPENEPQSKFLQALNEMGLDGDEAENEADTLQSIEEQHQEADKILQAKEEAERAEIENNRKRLEQLEADRKAQADEMEKMKKMLEQLATENLQLKTKPRLTFAQVKELEVKRQALLNKSASLAVTLDTLISGKKLIEKSVSLENDHENTNYFALSLTAINPQGHTQIVFNLTNALTIQKVVGDTETAVKTRIEQLRTEISEIENM